MNIETDDSSLILEIQKSAPEGVSVDIKWPRMTRDLNSIVPPTIIVLKVTAVVNVATLAKWLYEAVKSKKDTTVKYKHLEIEKTEKGFRVVFDSMKKTEGKQKDEP